VFGQALGQESPLFTEQMVVADVQFLEALDERFHQHRVPMAQVKDAAVAVAIYHALLAADVPQIGPFAATHHEIYACLLEEAHFARGDVAGKEGHNFFLWTGPDVRESSCCHFILRNGVVHLAPPTDRVGLDEKVRTAFIIP
jgi:hypothetical protein